MWLYLLKRLVLAITIIVIAVTLLFLMIHAVPGDPAVALLGPRASPEIRAALHEQVGLDQPLLVQVSAYFGRVLHGDLGFDPFSQRPVADIVFAQLPYTIELILVSISWAVAVAVPLGCYSAVRRNSALDQVVGIIGVATIAIPSFVMAVYALPIFAVALRWLPAIGPASSWLIKFRAAVAAGSPTGFWRIEPMSMPKRNLIEPAWYRPVCPVVWEGRRRVA
ncbi:MAG: ABC transporter permease [Mesorhizobium sp.]|nr:MAG: ABC transporter permease [Mesorhizobium sp.]